MNFRSFQLASRIAAVFGATVGLAAPFAGCGDKATNNRYPDASLSFDSSVDRRTSVDTAPRPAPPVGDGNRLLVPGRAQLIGVGTDSCSSLTSPTGDVWCAFALPSTFLGLTDLWVINVSQAMSGKDVLCNGNDPNCLRLTSTLATGSSSLQRYSIHGFFGDMLIYYADDSGGGNPAYAWRPGWTAGKTLATDASVGCTGDAKGLSAYCLGNIDDKSVAGQVSIDIHAGAIGDGSTTLPKIATAIIAAGTEQSITKFQVGLSPAGDWIAWSARPAAGGVETLNAQKLGDVATRQVIAQDVTQWSFARDGLKWFWLKSLVASATNGTVSGTLQMASFPPAGGGAAVTADTLMEDAGAFRVAGDKGLAVIHGVVRGSGDLSLIADRGAPMTVQHLDSGVIAIMDIASDGKTVLYAKNSQLDPIFGSDNSFYDIYANGAGRTTPCTVSPLDLTPSGAMLSSSGALASWIQFDLITGRAFGYLTDVAACRSQAFTSDLWYWTLIADDGIVYVENGGDNQSNVVDVTLKYGKFISGGLLPSTGMATTEIQQRAGLTYTSLLPAYPAALFTVYVGAGVDGLYISGPLPFAATPPAPPADGGATPSDGGATPSDGGAAPDAGNG